MDPITEVHYDEQRVLSDEEHFSAGQGLTDETLMTAWLEEWYTASVTTSTLP